ncbi:hypothetical protein [Aeromicrobium sp. UC242_57]|uniref:hypothetical protein n=1 Tax=Aeromicrobium sp. UC242_57 TaxID=3374624 RepID=UPI0037C025ED
MLDEIMGMQATITDQKLARTAYLKVDFRSPVPIDVPVQVTSWREGRDGRKHFVRAEMWAGETLCAEGDALFVELALAPSQRRDRSRPLISNVRVKSTHCTVGVKLLT